MLPMIFSLCSVARRTRGRKTSTRGCLQEKAAIREWVWDRAKPYFGVCLGHQLLCDALGGEVALAAEPEVGVFDVSLTPDGQEHGLFAGVGKQQQGDAVALGRGDAGAAGGEGSCHVCRESAIQSIAIDSHAISTQFHCEFTPQTMATWSSLPSYLAFTGKTEW